MVKLLKIFCLGIRIVAFLRRVDDLARCTTRRFRRLARYRRGDFLHVCRRDVLALVVCNCCVTVCGLRPGEVYERPFMVESSKFLSGWHVYFGFLIIIHFVARRYSAIIIYLRHVFPFVSTIS